MTDIATDTQQTPLGGVYKTPTESVCVAVAKDVPLQALTAQINAVHDDTCHADQSAFAHARRAGELLVEAKVDPPHPSAVQTLTGAGGRRGVGVDDSVRQVGVV